MITNNNEVDHGTTHITSNDAALLFYCIGLGHDTSKHVNLDIMYSVPFNKKFGYDHHSFPSRNYYKIVYGTVTFGFQYLFGK